MVRLTDELIDSNIKRLNFRKNFFMEIIVLEFCEYDHYIGRAVNRIADLL